MSYVISFRIFGKLLCRLFVLEQAGQTLNSYYKSRIVNIMDTILSWQLQCKHLVYIILY